MTDTTGTTTPHSGASIAPLRAGDPEEITLWEYLVPREVSEEDRSRFEGDVAEIFLARGTYEEEAGLGDEFLRAAGHR